MLGLTSCDQQGAPLWGANPDEQKWLSEQDPSSVTALLSELSFGGEQQKRQDDQDGVVFGACDAMTVYEMAAHFGEVLSLNSEFDAFGVMFVKPNVEDETCAIIISGMPSHTSEADMRAVFELNAYGDVASVTKEREEDPKMVRFTVVFYVRADAEKAILELAPTEDNSALHIMLKQPTEAEVVQSQQLGVLLDAWRSRAAWSRRVDSEAPKFMPIGSADHAGGSFWSTPLPPTLQSGPNDHSDEVLRQMLTGALTSPRSAISPAPFDEHHQREQFNHQREQFDHQREHLQREQFEHHHSQRDHHEHQHHMQQQQQYQHRPSHHHLQGPPPQLWQQQRNSWVCPATSAEMSHASIADAITDTYPQRCASRSFDSMPSQLPEMRFVHQHRRLDDWSQGLHDPMMPPMSRMEAEMQRDACEHQRMMQQQQQRAMRRVGRRERAPPMGLNEASTAFELDLDRISTGSDQRTTLMVRNIPNKYTQVAVLEEIDALFQNCYDCFYLPIDFKNKCNVGYAFINLVDFRDIPRFFQEFDGRRWSCYRSAKVCAITYARIQGKASMIARFQNSNLMHESIEVQPRLFRSFGPGKGLPEEFPELG